MNPLFGNYIDNGNDNDDDGNVDNDDDGNNNHCDDCIDDNNNKIKNTKTVIVLTVQ